MTTSSTGTDRRIQRTQQTLRTALLDLLAEKGYAAVTVQDIAERANIGRATFYLHYPDKEHLLLAWMEQIFAELRAYVGELAGADASTVVTTLSQLAFEHIANHHELYRTLLSERGSAVIAVRMRDLLAGFVEEQVRCQTGDSPAPPFAYGLLAQHTAGALLAAVTWWLNNEMAYTPAQMAEIYQQLILPGIIQAFP
jgi:AcrR family transcriptional regulator